MNQDERAANGGHEGLLSDAAFSRFVASITPPRFTSRDELAAWQRRLEETTGSVVRAIEAAEDAIRQLEAQKMRSLALLDALTAVAASTAWDERTGESVARERASDLLAARRSGTAEIATRTRTTEAQVGAAWDLARTAVREHPAALEALAQGTISARHVGVVVDEAASVPEDLRAGFGAVLTQEAAERTPVELRAWARKHRELAHPGSRERRHRAARAGRYVTLEPGRDGMCWLTAHLPTTTGAAIFDRLTAAAVAAQGPDEPRTLAQRRADALADYCLAAAPLPAPEAALAAPEALGTLFGDPCTTAPEAHEGADEGMARKGLESREELRSREGRQGREGHQGREELQSRQGLSVPEDPPNAGDLQAYGDLPTAEQLQTHGDLRVPEDSQVPKQILFSEDIQIPEDELARATLARSPLARRLAVAEHLATADDSHHVRSRANDVDIHGIRPSVAITVPHTLLLAAAAAAAHVADTDGTGCTGCTARSTGTGAKPRHGSGPGTVVDDRPGHHVDAPDPRAHDHPGSPPLAHAPELVGHGPIDDETALVLLAHAPSVRRILVDPSSSVALDMSRETYVVPAPLRTFLALRDEVCQFPCCRRPAIRCDIDHVEAWADGGTTSADNLVHLCRAHHRLKHGGGWQCEVIDPEGGGLGPLPDQRLHPMILRWTDPHGGVRITASELRPGRRDDDGMLGLDSSSGSDDDVPRHEAPPF